ncbi:hypothetical protein [Acaryochloris marina]|uniref:Uncharacterized protein n=1 Tax=Acaryochloris marina (strain MBIC 11017) TaxID=329726 RepID=B0CF02_ACAM1|nr:hypothetical protein [Acaryochloris marina]ABW29399.1 hypothetical protein AM1_4422 [Acaryochloris marina MBIC11017]BDM78315.1 hypothetical protein AM10699_11850 [Acaryochloris marina MBIC10699]
MPLERRLSRDAYLQNEIVILKQLCLTPSRMFQPGRYKVSELPDEAFTMGLVERAPIPSEENPDDAE